MKKYLNEGFNPYCYWSYLLTILVLYNMEKKKFINYGFNPYCYWSYLLTYIFNSIYLFPLLPTIFSFVNFP